MSGTPHHQGPRPIPSAAARSPDPLAVTGRQGFTSLAQCKLALCPAQAGCQTKLSPAIGEGWLRGWGDRADEARIKNEQGADVRTRRRFHMTALGRHARRREKTGCAYPAREIERFCSTFCSTKGAGGPARGRKRAARRQRGLGRVSSGGDKAPRIETAPAPSAWAGSRQQRQPRQARSAPDRSQPARS